MNANNEYFLIRHSKSVTVKNVTINNVTQEDGDANSQIFKFTKGSLESIDFSGVIYRNGQAALFLWEGLTQETAPIKRAMFSDVVIEDITLPMAGDLIHLADYSFPVEGVSIGLSSFTFRRCQLPQGFLINARFQIKEKVLLDQFVIEDISSQGVKVDAAAKNLIDLPQ